MAQTVTVQEVQNLEELMGLKRPALVQLMKQFKAEDTDCLSEVNGKSKSEELLVALANHMGFNSDVTTEVETAVQKDIFEAVNADREARENNMDGEPVDPSAGLFAFGDDANENPNLKPEEEQDVLDLFSEAQPEPEVLKLGGEMVEVEIKSEPTTGDTEVDLLLAELGLEGLDEFKPLEPTVDENKAEELPINFVEGWGIYGPQEAPKKGKGKTKEPKEPKAKKATIPMDAPIPVRQYENLILGIYGNILDEREEAFPSNHKFAGMTWEERKLERFNPKAHEVFRNTKGNMHLVYTNVGATYLIVMKKPDGTLDPVLEVANKGRGHLRCKQIANALQVAYNEKSDQEVISSEVYGKLAEQIETLPINLPVTEVAEA